MTPLEQLQQNAFDRIDNDVSSLTIVVLQEKEGVTDSDITQALGTVTQKGTKKGAVILVTEPFFDVEHPASSGPPMVATMYVRCIEQPLINRSPLGTGLTAEQLVLNVMQLLHNYVMWDIPTTLTVAKGDPIKWDDGIREYALTVKAMIKNAVLPKCAFPIITELSTDNITIACGTAGATIYWTTDGTYPCPGSATARAYAGPITTLAAGATLRAVAFNQPNYVASDLAYAVIT